MDEAMIQDSEETEEKQKPKYKIGEEVIFINDNGVNFGIKKIIGIRKVSYSESGFGYFLDKTDSPWFAVKEEVLKRREEDENKNDG